jgi:hypothetical protein
VSPPDVRVRIVAQVGQFQAAMRQALAGVYRFAQVFNDMGHNLHAQTHPAKHRRCARCHPRAFPKPLAIDGHAYRRRQRARRRRRA